MNIVTITHKHAKSYLIGAEQGYIMFDALWVDSFRALMIQLKENNIKLRDIKYLVVSHFHIDHAGLTQVLKDYGIKLLLLENQIGGIKYMNNFFDKKSDKNYVYIKEEDSIIVSPLKSRELLKEMSIDGEILATPGHSSDSVSLVIDNDSIFIGDLPPIGTSDWYEKQVSEDWNKILKLNLKTVYPAHAESFNIDEKE